MPPEHPPVGLVSAAPPAGRPETRQALRVPPFRKYLGVRALALLATAMSLVAMPLLAYRLTGSAALTTLVASGTFWPYLVFGLPAGALADRWNRRAVMVSCTAASAVVLASVPIAAAAGALTYPPLLVAELGVACLFVFGDAAALGVLPQRAGRRGLASATSALMITHSIVMLAGLVAQTAGPQWALRAVGLGLLISLAGVLTVGVHRYPTLAELESRGQE